MSVSVRVKSLSMSGLASAESHAKRLDGTSQMRRIRDREPLVYGSLDLRTSYDAHVDGCKMNRGLKKPVLHALVQFPTSLIIDERSERVMLNAAIKFINETHGGDAVFAARLDRDESGRHTVDVFFSPKYLKQTKTHGEEMWISTSKHGKELCEKHRDEIERRHGGKFNTRPRDVGIALNSEFRNFMTKRGFELKPKNEKKGTASDRLSPEEYKIHAENKRMHSVMRVVAKALNPLSELVPSKAWAFISGFLPKEQPRPVVLSEPEKNSVNEVQDGYNSSLKM